MKQENPVRGYLHDERANRFPQDLQKAYDLGKRLVEKAKI